MTDRQMIVGVIGAGTMGAGIAAHAASAGLDVVLLDIIPDGARQAVERLAKDRPPAFMEPSDARRITFRMQLSGSLSQFSQRLSGRNGRAQCFPAAGVLGAGYGFGQNF